jgi:hypothetical protein
MKKTVPWLTVFLAQTYAIRRVSHSILINSHCHVRFCTFRLMRILIQNLVILCFRRKSEL